MVLLVLISSLMLVLFSVYRYVENTWYRGDGLYMSRLDRFLLSKDWCAQCPSMIQRALLCSLLDHCPILLAMDGGNWGPRFQCMMKCCADLTCYYQFVKNKWQSITVFG